MINHKLGTKRKIEVRITQGQMRNLHPKVVLRTQAEWALFVDRRLTNKILERYDDLKTGDIVFLVEK